jgi:4-amino-4-deoxy-L-arabinose transferase-like glycosyltransferase
LASIYVFWRLTKEALPGSATAAFSFGLLFFLLPSAIVRNITVSNEPLLLLLALIFMMLLLRAYRTPGDAGFAPLLGSGLVLGLALLTSLLSVYLVVVFGAVLALRAWTDRRRRALFRIVACGVAPVVLLVPWIGFNEAHYSAFTANSIAEDMQRPTVNPHNHHYTIGEAPRLTTDIRFSFFMAEEWGDYYSVWSVTELRDALLTIFFLLPLLILAFNWGSIPGETLLFFALPMALNLAELVGATLIADWPVTAGRYLHSSAPLWMLFSFIAFQQVVGRAGVRALAVAGTVGALAVWAQIVPRYY